MTQRFHTPPSEIEDLAKRLGRNIRLARLRRGIPLSEMATKVGVTRKTMREIEQGRTRSALAHYATALWVLGLHEGLGRIADPDSDEHGKLLEASRLPQRARKPVAPTADYDF